jgi:2-phospho-L-lactate/phosphoenolpyruvate guanylyltransferase
MCIPVIIPFKPANPKTRLSHILSQEERELLAEAMLADVVDAVQKAGCEPIILATEEFSCHGIPVHVSKEGLNVALDIAMSQYSGPAAIIMADCALISPEAVRRLISGKEMMAIVPGRGGGTNAVFIQRGNAFKAHYYGQSYSKHLAYANEVNISYEIVDSFRLHVDIDEEEDLVEVFLHNEGKARKMLMQIGFELQVTHGRVGIARK